MLNWEELPAWGDAPAVYYADVVQGENTIRMHVYRTKNVLQYGASIRKGEGGKATYSGNEFDTREEAIHWCEMMLATGAV